MTATVYGVYKNSDMVEGRGPFALVCLFSDWVTAREFARRQRGVMGRSGFRNHEELRQRLRERGLPDDRFKGSCAGWFCNDCWPFGGDWRVDDLLVYDTLEELKQARQATDLAHGQG